VDVSEPTHFAVDQVFALTGTIEPAGHLDVSGDALLVFAVGTDGSGDRRDARQHETHLGCRRRLPRLAAVEDHVHHLVTAQALGALLAQHPDDGIGDVALAAPVGPDDGGDATVEGELGPLGKRLEPGDL